MPSGIRKFGIATFPQEADEAFSGQMPPLIFLGIDSVNIGTIGIYLVRILDPQGNSKLTRKILIQ
jgi:hypothetical protein